MRKIDKRILSYHLIFLIVAAMAAGLFTLLRWYLNGTYLPADFRFIMEGTADKHFQYRFLFSWLIGLIVKPGYSIPFLKSGPYMFMYLEGIATFLLLVSFRYYISMFIPNRVVTFIFPFILFYVLPFNFLYPSNVPIRYPWILKSIMFFPNSVAIYYPYDLPSMTLFTLGLILLYKRKMFHFYILFTLATLNRETTCFLTFIYLFTNFGIEKRRTLVTHAFAQFAIWSGIRIILTYFFRDNPGDSVEIQFRGNLAYFSDPENWLYFSSSFGFLWIPVVLFHKQITNHFVKRSLLVVVPFFPGMMIVGVIGELRIYCELIPLFVAAFLLILYNLTVSGHNQDKISSEARSR